MSSKRLPFAAFFGRLWQTTHIISDNFRDVALSAFLSTRLSYLRNHHGCHALAAMNRGIERECLRITAEGRLATSPHPAELGSKLTHPLITTDYAESLLEFITPVSQTIDTTLAQLRDIHRATYQAMDEELMWPLSMPCYFNELSDIHLADYGSSHIGRMKTTYREGLTHRYGAVMQTIAGVHFNWSVSDELWSMLAAADGQSDSMAFRSASYFGLLRNFKRWAWVIPYLFGASPVLCQSFLRHSQSDLEFRELGNGLVCVPNATSLRMSDLGYTNKEQSALAISYNSLEEYVNGLRTAVFTRSAHFSQIGVRDGDHWRQLNDNILQIENEFYSPIRPKRVTEQQETPTQALERGGVQYIEVRALDVNPFSPVGIDEEQIRFLDVFLLFCLLSESPALSLAAQKQAEKNLSTVVLRGREPDLRLTDEDGEQALSQRLACLFAELAKIAVLLDTCHSDREAQPYSRALAVFSPAIHDPSQTFSARVQQAYESAIAAYQQLGMRLAIDHKEALLTTPFEIYTADYFAALAEQSKKAQELLEASSTGTYAEFLDDYFLRARNKKNAP